MKKKSLQWFALLFPAVTGWTSIAAQLVWPPLPKALILILSLSAIVGLFVFYNKATLLLDSLIKQKVSLKDHLSSRMKREYAKELSEKYQKALILLWAPGILGLVGLLSVRFN